MRLYRKVEIDPSADDDIDELYDYLVQVMSYDSARRYVLAMIDEVNSLAAYADCFVASRSATIRKVYPGARRMVSHNKKWIYVFHIEDVVVVVDRILKEVPFGLKTGFCRGATGCFETKTGFCRAATRPLGMKY